MRVKARSKKPLFMIAVFALVVALSIGLTSAFLTSTVGLTNTFTPGSVTCRVEEGFNGNNEKSSITVRNTGTIPAYIRVAVVANTVDAEGNITGAADAAVLSNKLVSSGSWNLNSEDGYYYYSGVVDPNDSTLELLKPDASINLSGIQVTVLAQAIQAHGVTGDLMAAEDAWKVNPTTGASVDAQ